VENNEYSGTIASSQLRNEPAPRKATETFATELIFWGKGWGKISTDHNKKEKQIIKANAGIKRGRKYSYIGLKLLNLRWALWRVHSLMAGAPHVMFAVLAVSCAAYRLVGILPRAYGLVYFTGTECWRRRRQRHDVCLSTVLETPMHTWPSPGLLGGSTGLDTSFTQVTKNRRTKSV
jgi:hypothetical protein